MSNSKKNKLNLKSENMSNLLYAVALILLIIWATGYFAYNAGGIIHVILVIAIIAVLLRVIRGRDAL